MTFWTKLKAEWKTFSLAVAGAVVGGYDVVAEVAKQYGYDYTQLIKAEWRIYVIPAFAVSMLALRKWYSSVSIVPDLDTPVVPDVPEVDPEVK